MQIFITAVWLIRAFAGAVGAFSGFSGTGEEGVLPACFPWAAPMEVAEGRCGRLIFARARALNFHRWMGGLGARVPGRKNSDIDIFCCIDFFFSSGALLSAWAQSNTN